MSPIGAAFVNASVASILDIDDGHARHQDIPVQRLFPAVVAEAQERKSSLKHTLLAIIAGYETRVLCTGNRTPDAVKATVASGRWMAIGVAAGLAKLGVFDVLSTQHAITIAETHAPNLHAADRSGYFGSDLKEGIPWPVEAGFAAAGLAEGGHAWLLRSLSTPSDYRE